MVTVVTDAPVVDSSVSTRRLRVAQVITKFTAGAGAITLHGSIALDQSRYAVTILAPEGGPLAARAVSAGLEMVVLSHMVPDLDPRSDLRGLSELVRLLRAGRYDLVHTHSAKAGAIGRWAARAVGVPAIVHSFHGFPFHEFQSTARRHAYLAIERRLARFTDQFVTDGTWVAAEAVRLGISPPERIRAISSPIDTNVRPATDAARAEARRVLMLPASAKIVGTVARLDEQKDPLEPHPSDREASSRRVLRVDRRRLASSEHGGGDPASSAGGPLLAPRRTQRRGDASARVRRVRDAEPVRRPAVRDRRGHGVWSARRSDGRQLGAGGRGTWSNGVAGEASGRSVAGQGTRLCAGSLRACGSHGSRCSRRTGGAIPARDPGARSDGGLRPGFEPRAIGGQPRIIGERQCDKVVRWRWDRIDRRPPYRRRAAVDRVRPAVGRRTHRGISRRRAGERGLDELLDPDPDRIGARAVRRARVDAAHARRVAPRRPDRDGGSLHSRVRHAGIVRR